MPYHVNTETGKTGVCHARERECPLGGETGTDNHYSNEIDAENAAQKLMEEKYGKIPKVSKITPSEAADRIVSDANNAFSYHRGGQLDDKDTTLNRLLRDRSHLQSFISKTTESLIMSDLDKDEMKDALKALSPYRKAVSMADDAIAILDDNSVAVPSKNITSDSYDSNGNKGDYREGVAEDKASARKYFDTYMKPSLYNVPEDSINKQREKYVDDVLNNPKALKEVREWNETHDEEGNTIYRGVNVVDDKVTYEGTVYTRLTDDVVPGEPYSFRIQVGKELTDKEAEHLAGCIGYAYSKTGGEGVYGYDQDSPNSIVISADTTKGRAYKHLDTFVEDVPTMIQEGSPVRKTDRAGAGTKGTRLVDGMGDVGYVEIYADHAY